MEEEKEKKRWSVAYTKHIKQKRKVYHDGFLDLHISSNKLMLYDESDKLLECRMLRRDEVVSSAQTLTFAAYFVDVGLLQSPPYLNFSDARKKSNEVKPIDRSLSPSQKIIREFKKNELQKYVALQTGPTTTKASVTVPTTKRSIPTSQILYTSPHHLASYCQRQPLDKDPINGVNQYPHLLIWLRLVFAKEAIFKEMIAIMAGAGNELVWHMNVLLSPKMLQLEAYVELLSHNEACETKYQLLLIPDHEKYKVLYTTQVTQKAKKYHDGFLKLVNSAALQRQIMLYDGSKKLINSRFLNKDEVIQSGESITFDAHLVNIGEAEGNHPGLMDSDVHVSNYNAAGKTEMIHRVQNRLKTRKSFLKGKPQKIASSKVYSDPSFSIPIIAETKSSQNISADKPLRDATQILSILRKPMIQVGIATQSIDKNVMNPVSSVKDPQNSYSTKNFIECSQLQEISIAHHGSKNLESYTKCCNDESVLGSWSRAAETCDERVGLMEDCTEVKNSREAGRCPSFDLGFD
ncbi:hypothetical protein CXB51_005583 [Gossypium anomalum]|uniref:5'-3' DNA helicase ZGRF1-like N-terminal domain-containing protein n=1 Tax=Gossypium anomalum TaxID=47600 RepID=A0A8J5ZI08_9ROSI|nr:hypothetical protein CXB51_005583 [Gossypium anomalum]